MKSYKHTGRLVGAMLCAAGLSLFAASCDTTEEGYHVGTLSDVYLTTEPAVQLRVPADGQPRDIKVLSNVDWEFDDLEGVFAATADDRRGDGTITVTAGLNVNDQPRSGSLHLYTKDFDKSLTIELIQARMNFTMTTSDSYPEAPEQGASYALTFGSSIDWHFNVLEGEASWLDFNPGISGGGEWNEISVNAAWRPNYTTSPRSITMQLTPDDEDLLAFISLPQRFTLTQAAGTLPTNVSATVDDEIADSTATVSLTYKSNAPVDELGVIISSTGEYFVAPLQEGESYPQSGNYSFSFPVESGNFTYILTPFVRSKVGETKGAQFVISRNINDTKIPEEGDNKPIN